MLSTRDQEWARTLTDVEVKFMTGTKRSMIESSQVDRDPRKDAFD